MHNTSSSWPDFAPVAMQLKRVTKLVAASVPPDTTPAPAACRYLADVPGKALRAALLLLSTRFGALPAERYECEAISLAVAVELLHTATLYHDDVIDNASLRRGLPSANARWGNRVSTYAGDYVLSRAAERFAEAGDYVNQLASKAISRLSAGEMKEMEVMNDLEVTVSRRLRIVAAKTATLFELSCLLGAWVSNVDARNARAIARFGRRIGVAFQLIDDLQDLLGDRLTLGKEPGIDLRQGVFSIAIIHCLSQNSKESIWLKRGLGSHTKLELGQLRGLLQRSGSVDFALHMIDKCLCSAESALEVLDPGAPRKTLFELAWTLRARTKGFVETVDDVA